MSNNFYFLITLYKEPFVVYKTSCTNEDEALGEFMTRIPEGFLPCFLNARENNQIGCTEIGVFDVEQVSS